MERPHFPDLFSMLDAAFCLLYVSGLGDLVLTWYHTQMPPKIRELIRDLEAVGFKSRGGKGSHRNFKHSSGIRITISGSPGSDAKPYQEKAVRLAIEQVSE